MTQIRPLTETLVEVARVELNEDPKRFEECLNNIKDWIRKQPHLTARTDDQWLVAFLRGCKWSLERTKEKIDIYYSLRSTAADLFCLHYKNPKIMDIINKGVGLALPKTASPTSPRVIIIRPGTYDPDEFSVMEITAAIAKLQQVTYLEDDTYTVCGTIIIMDLQGTKLSHFLSMTPLQMRKIITLNQEAAPTRVKEVHFVNMPTFIEKFFTLAKSFLSEKLKQRLHVHNNGYSDLYKHIPRDIFPVEHGGHDYTLQEMIEFSKQKLQQYQAWFEEDLQYGTDESKRLEESKTSTMFGLQGSFKSLDFD